MRDGFLPQVALRRARLGQDEAPAPSPAPSGDGSDGFGGRFHHRFPFFFPTFITGPSLPFYWNQPYYPPPPPPRPRYICTKDEDEEGEERFICEPEQPVGPPYGPPFAPFVPRASAFYVRPYAGSFFF